MQGNPSRSWLGNVFGPKPTGSTPGFFERLFGRGMTDEERGKATAEVEGRDEVDEALYRLVEDRYQYARMAKEPMLRVWATCLAFYVGEQHRQWDRRARRLVQRNTLPSWRVQITDNRMPTIVETAAAKLARARQIPKALPNTDEDEDQWGADAGSAALEHWWHRDGMEAKELEANIHRLLFGDAFYHDYWDPSKQARVPVVDPMTGQTQARSAAVGDVCVEVLSVFDVFPAPGERWDEIPWCVVARRKPLQWFRETFGEKGARVKAEVADTESVFETLLPGAFGTEGASPSTPKGDGSATLKVYYEARSSRYPNGRHVMIAGQEVLYREDALPMPHGEIPLSKKGYRLVPKRMWCSGQVEIALQLQKELNRGRSYMSQNLRLHGQPRLMLAKESRVNDKEISNNPDEVLEYSSVNGGVAPAYLTPPALQSWVQTFADQQWAAIQQVVGQHEVSNATVPTGVKSGVAIDLLQKQDDTRLAVPNILGKVALENVSRHVLVTVVERYREPRLIATLGRGNQRQVQALMGSDIGNRDVLVEITEGVADTKAARAQKFMDWMSTGLFDRVFGPQLWPAGFVKETLQELGEGWMVEALEHGVKEQQMQQAQIQQQQMAMMAEQQGMAEQQMALEAGAQEQQAQAQQAELMLKAQAQQAAQDGQAQQVALKQAELAQRGEEGAAGRDSALMQAVIRGMQQQEMAKARGAQGARK